jgi:hypothetical protein
LTQHYAYKTDCNVVYEPNLRALFNPIQNVVADIPLDVPIGHHAFKVGVDFRYWTQSGWADTYRTDWGTPIGALPDQVLIDYPPARNFRVFIIHSEADRDFCDDMSDYIKRSGQVPYIAESMDNLALGKKLWEEKIETAIRASNVVLLLWTQNCVSSQAVRYEISRAKQLGKRIIPAIENASESPEIVKGLVYARFDRSDVVGAARTIVRSLLDYEAEINQQQNQELVGLIALLGLAGLVGAALGSK